LLENSKKIFGKKIDKKWGINYYCKMKRCYICQEEKEKSEFYIDNSQWDKLCSKCKKCQNIRKEEKRSSIPVLKLIENLKRRIRQMVSQYEFDKTNLSNEMLGIDRDGLQLYFEKRFRDGMTWDNYGTHWVVDHILPMDSVKTYEDLVRLSHYSNLQPLLKKENMSKGKKFVAESYIKQYFPYAEIMVSKKKNDVLDTLFEVIKENK
jgi:hypothetical protein